MANEAIDNVNCVVAANNTDESQQFYSKWANSYDKDMKTLDFGLAEGTAKAVMELIKNSSTKQIQLLDVAAGTGLVAAELSKLKFKGTMDALEGNKELLDIARKSKLYTNCVLQMILPESKLDVKYDFYDFVTCCGALIPNHVPPSSVKYMIPVLKPGGILVCTTRSSPDNRQYKDELDKCFQHLVDREIIVKILERDVLHFGTVGNRKSVTSTLYCYQRI